MLSLGEIRDDKLNDYKCAAVVVSYHGLRYSLSTTSWNGEDRPCATAVGVRPALGAHKCEKGATHLSVVEGRPAKTTILPVPLPSWPGVQAPQKG